MRLFNIGAEGQLYLGAIFGAAAGLYLGDGGSTSWLTVAAMVLCGARRRRALGADPGRAAGVLPDERDHHLADAQLRGGLPAHVPDLREPVVLAGDEGVQRERLPDAASNCRPRPSGPRGTLDIQGGVVVPLGLLIGIGIAVALWFLYQRTRFGFEVQVVSDSERAARYGGVRIRRKILAVMGDLGRDRRHRRGKPGRRLRPLGRRRPQRPPEARVRLHRHRHRRARPLQPVRDRRDRVPDRRARERRQHAPGRRLPRRARRRDPGDHPLLRPRRRAARPLPRADRARRAAPAAARRRPSREQLAPRRRDRLGRRLRDAAPLRVAGRAPGGALGRAQPRRRGDDARRGGDGLLGGAAIPLRRVGARAGARDARRRDRGARDGGDPRLPRDHAAREPDRLRPRADDLRRRRRPLVLPRERPPSRRQPRRAHVHAGLPEDDAELAGRRPDRLRPRHPRVPVVGRSSSC